MPNDSTDGMGGRPASVEPPRRSNRTVTPAIAAALVVLAASFALSVAFVLANGGLDLPAAQRPSSSTGAVGATTTPTASALPTSTAVAEASGASPEASPSRPAATATPGASTSAPPTPGTTPRPSSNRYDLLTACPGTPDCWIYVVREGDNLFSIARYFGLPLSVVEERNPWTKTTQLVAGQKLLLPPPTR
ncbi:MAG: LysM peptidoglycan-binding domain-containing protein [Candidatus Limnocylindrales bacterium]